MELIFILINLQFITQNQRNSTLKIIRPSLIEILLLLWIGKSREGLIQDSLTIQMWMVLKHHNSRYDVIIGICQFLRTMSKIITVVLLRQSCNRRSFPRINDEFLKARFSIWTSI